MTQVETYKLSEDRKQIIEQVVAGTVTTTYSGLCNREDYSSVADLDRDVWKITKKTIDSATGLITQYIPVVDDVKKRWYECTRADRASYTYL